MPDALAFNAELVALGAGTPPQGTNLNTPPKRLLAHGQGTGQHRDSHKPPPSGVESLTAGLHTGGNLALTKVRC